MAENENNSEADANAGDSAADDWAAMLDGEAANSTDVMGDDPMAAAMGMPEPTQTEPSQPERVLNQDEIDLLLGFDSIDSNQGSDTGIEAILGKSLMAYEKLPMLEVVFDRLVRNMSTSLRNFTSEVVDVSIDSMTSLRFGEYLNSIPLPALLVIFRAVEWENFGLITIDSSLIYSTVDVLLGGRRSTRSVRVEGRPYTTIEQDIVKRMSEVVLADMSAAFDPLSPVTFVHERIENNPRFATISRPTNAALLIRLRVEMEDRGGIIEVLIPHATLEPIRDLLMQIFMGEHFGQDAVWRKHLEEELQKTDVEIYATLDEKILSMTEVLKFRVGSTILLDCSLDAEVMLKSGGVELTQGKLGRVGDKIAVSINQAISEKTKELL